MVNHYLASRRGSLLILTIVLVALCGARANAQGTSNNNAERQRAIELVNNDMYAQALPILERLSDANPNDAEVLRGLGLSLAATSRDTPDSPARRQARIRARGALLRARELGARDALIETVLEVLPPDGSGQTEPFSRNPEADRALREGETAFTRGEIDRALSLYERAFRLDPRSYEAALFAGDMHYRKREWDRAAEWFNRAIAIDADRETAYRYWGDALMQQGRMDEARAKFLDAIVAEPYSRLAWQGLIHWSQRANVRLSHPRIQPPGASEARGDQGFTIDPQSLRNEDGTIHWRLYQQTRTEWANGRFAREYPNARGYRHSLREETAALRAVAEAAQRDASGGRIRTLDQSLANLLRLHEAGLIEAYVLLARANEGIAQDYAEYRRANRDKLRRYLSEHVAPSSQTRPPSV